METKSRVLKRGSPRLHTYAFPTFFCRMTSYNPALGLRGLSVSLSPRRAGTRCDIQVDEAVGAPDRYRYMYTPLEERATSLERGLLSLQVRFGMREKMRAGGGVVMIVVAGRCM